MIKIKINHKKIDELNKKLKDAGLESKFLLDINTVAAEVCSSRDRIKPKSKQLSWDRGH